MQDVYYTEARLSDTSSVITVAIDQLRDTPASLLSLLLQIVNVAVRWVLKQHIIISKRAVFFQQPCFYFSLDLFFFVYKYKRLNN